VQAVRTAAILALVRIAPETRGDNYALTEALHPGKEPAKQTSTSFTRATRH